MTGFVPEHTFLGTFGIFGIGGGRLGPSHH